MQVAELMHERIDKLEDFVDKASFFGGDCLYDDKATKMLLPKKRTQKEMAEALLKAAEVIDGMGGLELESLKEAMNSLREELELKGKEFLCRCGLRLRAVKIRRRCSSPWSFLARKMPATAA